MELKQIQQYNEEGYVIIKNLLSQSKVKELLTSASKLYTQNRDELILEKNGEINGFWDIHRLSKSFGEVAFSDSVKSLSTKILGEESYIHQSKIHVKKGFFGRDIKWHQDFVFWHNLDGMPEPKSITVAIFLDDVTEFNCPLYVIPKTHKKTIQSKIQRSIIDTQHNANCQKKGVEELTYELDNNTIKNLVNKYGIQSIKEKSGTGLIFDCRLVHASNANISPWDRNIYFITYNDMTNILVDINNPRPNYVATRKIEKQKKVHYDYP